MDLQQETGLHTPPSRETHDQLSHREPDYKSELEREVAQAIYERLQGIDFDDN